MTRWEAIILLQYIFLQKVNDSNHKNEIQCKISIYLWKFSASESNKNKNSSFMMHNEMESSNTYLDSISGNRRKTYYDHAQMR